MGITPHGFDFLGRFLGKPPLSIFEFGNQHFHDARGREVQCDGEVIAKHWFAKQGHRHVGLDLNGRDGSLQRDMCADLSDLGQFDIVTNFGSSEHVENQLGCWANFHKLCKPGGVMIHCVPMVGNWPGHCPWRYKREFFELLAEWNNYSVDGLETSGECGDDRHLIYAALRKYGDGDFAWTPYSLIQPEEKQ